jgi:hypothetical protein
MPALMRIERAFASLCFYSSLAGCAHRTTATAVVAGVPALKTITLACRAPAPGQSWTAAYDTRGVFKENTSKGVKEHHFHNEQEMLFEILASSPTEVTSARVTFLLATAGAIIDGKDERSALPVELKSYLYQHHDGQIEVTMDDGSPVPDREIVAKENDTIGNAPAMLRVLSGRTFTAGQTVTLNADERRKTRRSSEQVTQASVTFLGMSGALARFRSEFTADGPEPGRKTSSADVALVDPGSCQPHEVQGTATSTGPTGSVDMQLRVHRGR